MEPTHRPPPLPPAAGGALPSLSACIPGFPYVNYVVAPQTQPPSIKQDIFFHDWKPITSVPGRNPYVSAFSIPESFKQRLNRREEEYGRHPIPLHKHEEIDPQNQVEAKKLLDRFMQFNPPPPVIVGQRQLFTGGVSTHSEGTSAEKPTTADHNNKSINQQKRARPKKDAPKAKPQAVTSATDKTMENETPSNSEEPSPTTEDEGTGAEDSRWVSEPYPNSMLVFFLCVFFGSYLRKSCVQGW